MSVHVTFEDLAQGDEVTTQFSDRGITFTNPTGKVAQDPLAPSQTSLESAWDGGPVEFPNRVIKATFSAANHSRISFVLNRAAWLYVYDKVGGVIADGYFLQPPLEVDEGTYFSAEFATGLANIASFKLWSSGQPFRLADLGFDNTSPGTIHRPDFRFLHSNTNADTFPTHPGTGEFNVRVARLYGSTGPIQLSLSTTPNGILTVIPVLADFNGGDGSNIRIPFTASATVMDAKSITLTGTPASAAVGGSTRMFTAGWRPGLEPVP